MISMFIKNEKRFRNDLTIFVNQTYQMPTNRPATAYPYGNVDR